MKKMIIAVAVIAIAAAMCIPACVFADNSDAACTKTNGSAGISVELSTSDEKEIVKFFPKADWNDDATGIWTSSVFSSLFANRTSYDVTEGKIVEVKYTKAMGKEITDDYISEVNSSSQIMKYSFKATCKTDNLAIFDNSLGQLIKYIEPTNKSHKDATFTITVTVEQTTSSVSKGYITKNNDNDYVVTEADGETFNKSSVSAEVKYSYGTISKDFTYEKIDEMFMKGDFKLDFMGVDPKDAKSTTNVLYSTMPDDYKVVQKTVVKCDGKTYTNKEEIGKSAASTELSRFTQLGYNSVYTGELKVPVYKFYGDDEYSVFNDMMVDDASLKNNDAMKNYVKDKGSIGEDFSAAKSTAESPMPSSGGTNILLFVAIGIGAVVIIAVVAFIFLKKK